jgi:DNA-binding MarR family transcriptional regulator
VPSAASAPTAADAVRALARVARLLERSSGELSLAHYRVLSAVASGEERASRVATRLALGRPAISAAVESLCGRGLLDRAGVAADGRAASLTVTTEGARVLGLAEAEMTERLDELCGHTPDRARVLEALGWLGAAMDEARR